MSLKKMAKLFFAFVLAICLTGCVKYNVSMEVKDDKSVTLEIIYGMEVDSSLMEDDSDDDYDYEDDTEGGISTEDYKFLEEKGFKVEEFTETKDESVISGVKLTKTYANIDEITKDKKIVVDFNNMFDQSNADSFDDSQYFSRDGNNYVANFVFDFSDEESDESTIEALDSMVELEYKVKLPKKAISSNATSVSKDGRELTWDLKYGKKNEVNFKFSYSNNNLFLIIVIIAGIVVVAGGLFIVFSKRKKNISSVNKI